MKIFLSNFCPFPIKPELEKWEKNKIEKKIRGPSNIIFKIKKLFLDQILAIFFLKIEVRGSP